MNIRGPGTDRYWGDVDGVEWRNERRCERRGCCYYQIKFRVFMKINETHSSLFLFCFPKLNFIMHPKSHNSRYKRNNSTFIRTCIIMKVSIQSMTYFDWNCDHKHISTNILHHHTLIQFHNSILQRFLFHKI